MPADSQADYKREVMFSQFRTTQVQGLLGEAVRFQSAFSSKYS